MPKLTTTFPKIHVTTEDQALTLTNMICDLKLVSFDTETTGLDPYSHKCLLVSYSLPESPWKDSWGDPRIFGVDEFGNPLLNTEVGSRFVFEASNIDVCLPLITITSCSGINVIAHNYKFDAHFIYNTWKILPGKNGIVFDTAVMDHLFDENRSSRHGLKECCEDYGLYSGMRPFKSLFSKPPRGINMSEGEWALLHNKEEFLEYSATDCYATWKLFKYLRNELEKQYWYDESIKKDSNLFEYYVKYESEFIKSVWEMEHNGAYVVPGSLQKYEKPMVEKMLEIERFYAGLAGEIVNLNSHQQVRKLLFEKLKLTPVSWTVGGQSGVKSPSTDAEALGEMILRGDGEYVLPLMIYRRISKLFGTYVKGLQNEIKSDGRVHSTFSIHVVVTKRLSSSSPNLQNICNKEEDTDIVSLSVKDYDIRSAFQAPEGRSLIIADYSQLEVVICAHVTQEKSLIDALKNGLDVHANTAALMLGVPYDSIIAAKKAKEPTQEQKALLEVRRAAKTITFGLMYGQGPDSLAMSLRITPEKAQEYINLFYKVYPGILMTKEDLERECIANGFITCLLGLRRRLPEIYSEKTSIKNRAKRQLFNARIQASGSALMRFYMPAIANDLRLKELDAKLILQVHDEVIVECPSNHAEEVKQIVDKHLMDAMPFIPWVVPLKVESIIAKSWSEKK